MTIQSPPTLAGFTWFVYNVMSIPVDVLPTDSAVIPVAYQVALNLVLKAICQVDPLSYTLAVYNLGGSNLINYAQDVPNAPIYKNYENEPLAYFAYYRALWKINDFVTGVVQSSSDEGTSVGLLVQDALKDLTIADLQSLKDPYGRKYLGITQQFGSLWGLTC